MMITTSVMVNPIIKKLLSAAASEKQSNGTVKSVATGRLLAVYFTLHHCLVAR